MPYDITFCAGQDCPIKENKECKEATTIKYKGEFIQANTFQPAIDKR